MRHPNKFLHAAELESWITEHHSAIFSEWELSGLVEWLDFWDWLDKEYPEVLTAFRDWFGLAEGETLKWREGDSDRPCPDCKRLVSGVDS